MFNFDGEFRRRPQQNLGGASLKTDRLTIIRKAQHERQKREEARRQQNGATVIQCAVRSFIQRQQTKQRERDKVDVYRRNIGNIRGAHDLEYLTKRVIFFYSPRITSDGDRLIFLCQYMIKNPTEVFKLVARDAPVWTFHIKRLLGLCLGQILLPDHSPTVPMRMLEIYSSDVHVTKHIRIASQEVARPFVRNYLMAVYGYLIERRYFHVVRRLLEEKLPPIDDEDTAAINRSPIAAALFEMLLRPLELVTRTDKPDNLSRQILQSFTFNVLSQELSGAVKYYLLVALSERDDFPYRTLIQCIADEYQARLDYRSTILIDLTGSDEQPPMGGKSGTAKKPRTDQLTDECLLLSSSLLYSLLKLDERHIASMATRELFSAYLKVIASMVDNITKLPRDTISSLSRPLDDSSDSESESDVDGPTLGSIEAAILQEIICMLNENRRVAYLVGTIDTVLDDAQAMQNLCQVCHSLMTFNRMAVYEYKLLYMLASKPAIIRNLWYTLTAHSMSQRFSSPIVLLSKGLNISKEDSDRTIPILASFCALFGRLIASLHDGEFVQENVLPGSVSSIMPFSIAELIPLSTTLKEISLGLVELAFPETRSFLDENYRSMISSLSSTPGPSSADSPARRRVATTRDQSKQIWPHLLKVCVSLLRQIHTRDLRRCFCPEGHWTAQNLNLPLDKPTDLHLSRAGRRGPRPFQPIRDFTREDIEDGPPLSTKQIRSITILREIPFVVPFNTRVGVFQGLVAADKLRTQGDLQGFLQGPSIQLTVRRSHLYEDAFDKLSPTNEPDLRPKFRIEMVNSAGLREAGVDGGGVFREFLSELIKVAFDPHRGFFMITKDNMLYPNPSVGTIVEDFQRHYYFIGRILGKALYENLLVELPLAEFFLSKLAGKHSDVDVHQLASLDPVLYRNLMSLKAYDGDVADLGLDFTVVCDALGVTKVEELKPNGTNIIVNSSNRIEYIQLMADFKLNQQIRAQCVAFRQGLANVLPIEWLYMFSNKELQVLISGAEIPVDVHDLRQHTRYGGDFSLEHPAIQLFWKVVEQFDDIQRRLLLKFVTSCSRPPLLGFKDLDPPFCIQNAGDTDRLPSASTCMNLLKLPAFEQEDVLREKLLYAIQSGAGFELS